MECRVVFVMVFTIGFVGFSTAGSVEKRTSCATQCNNCYSGADQSFLRMKCEGDCEDNGGTISCDTSKRASSSSVNNKVLEFNKKWADLMKADDISGIKDTYVTDCAYVTISKDGNGKEIVQQGFGKEDMGKAYKNWLDSNDEKLDKVEFTVIKAAKGSNLVFAYGKMKEYLKNGDVGEHNYIKFYQESSDGSLKGYIDIVWS